MVLTIFIMAKFKSETEKMLGMKNDEGKSFIKEKKTRTKRNRRKRRNQIFLEQYFLHLLCDFIFFFLFLFFFKSYLFKLLRTYHILYSIPDYTCMKTKMIILYHFQFISCLHRTLLMIYTHISYLPYQGLYRGRRYNNKKEEEKENVISYVHHLHLVGLTRRHNIITELM